MHQLLGWTMELSSLLRLLAFFFSSFPVKATSVNFSLFNFLVNKSEGGCGSVVLQSHGGVMDQLPQLSDLLAPVGRGQAWESPSKGKRKGNSFIIDAYFNIHSTAAS